MATLICGSLAFDTIMNFEGRFADQILPDQLHILNVSFLVPTLRRDFGGCAGNIAYALKVLGGAPVPMATVGNPIPVTPLTVPARTKVAAMARLRLSSFIRAFLMCAAAVLRSLFAIKHTVIPDHACHSEPVIVEDRVTPLMLNTAV